MLRTIDALLTSLERLENALGADATGREHDWSRRIHGALESVIQGLRSHTADTESESGVFAEIDLTRPTFARQAATLRHEHTTFLDRALALQRELKTVCQVFGGGPAMMPAATSIPEFGTLRDRLRALIVGLRRHGERETDLVQESMSVDIGVGD